MTTNTLFIMVWLVIPTFININLNLQHFKMEFGSLESEDKIFLPFASIGFAIPCGPFSIIFFYFILDKAKHGWLLPVFKKVIFKNKKEKTIEYVEKELMDIFYDGYYHLDVHMTIFAFLELANIKDKYNKKDVSRFLKRNTIRGRTFKNSVLHTLVDHGIINLDFPEKVDYYSKKPIFINSNFTIHEKYDNPSYFLFEDLEIISYHNTLSLDMLSIEKDEETIKILENKNFNYVFIGNLILIENARFLPLPNQVKSKKLKIHKK